MMSMLMVRCAAVGPHSQSRCQLSSPIRSKFEVYCLLVCLVLWSRIQCWCNTVKINFFSNEQCQVTCIFQIRVMLGKVSRVGVLLVLYLPPKVSSPFFFSLACHGKLRLRLSKFLVVCKFLGHLSLRYGKLGDFHCHLSEVG